jgi:hypothetical protein
VQEPGTTEAGQSVGDSHPIPDLSHELILGPRPGGVTVQQEVEHGVVHTFFFGRRV